MDEVGMNIGAIVFDVAVISITFAILYAVLFGRGYGGDQ